MTGVLAQQRTGDGGGAGAWRWIAIHKKELAIIKNENKKLRAKAVVQHTLKQI